MVARRFATDHKMKTEAGALTPEYCRQGWESTLPACLICDCVYGNARRISAASAAKPEARSLPLAVLIRTVISLRRTLICNPL